MRFKRPVRVRVLGLIAAAGLAGSALAGSTGLAAAATSPGCPVVNASTGAVTPSPSPGVSWKDCDLTGANLSGADLAGASLYESGGHNVNLSGADLSGAELGFWWGGSTTNLAGADLSGADLLWAQFDGADLASAKVTDANIQYATLDSANVTGAIWTGSFWVDTVCPDGSNSNLYDDGCFSPLNTSTPTAHPSIDGSRGSAGWYSSISVLNWNWTDAGPLTPNCTGQTFPPNGASGDPLTFTASCEDLAGHTGTATFTVLVDPAAPAVVVTGVRNGQRYTDGAVPAPRCQTTESPSGVARAAAVKVTGGSRLGVGGYTATCSGALTVAGVPQAAPVKASYSVVFGFGGFLAPNPASRIVKKQGSFTARFRLVTAAGRPISAKVARAVAAAHLLRLELKGPGLGRASAVACRWARDEFTCSMPIPAAVRTGKKDSYTLTLLEHVPTGPRAGPVVVAPPAGSAANPETIRFR